MRFYGNITGKMLSRINKMKNSTTKQISPMKGNRFRAVQKDQNVIVNSGDKRNTTRKIQTEKYKIRNWRPQQDFQVIRKNRSWRIYRVKSIFILLPMGTVS